MKYTKFFNIIKDYIQTFLESKYGLEKDEDKKLINLKSKDSNEFVDLQAEDPMDIYYEVKHRDDTKPYIPNFSSGGSGSLFLTKMFKDQGRELLESDYIELIKEKINKDNLNDGNKSFVLFKIWSDAKRINNLLSPLKGLGINYTLDLTGGSVRDFLLDKEDQIKDLDFMLSISWQGFQSDEIMKKIPAHFSANELNEVDWGSLLRDVQEKESSDEAFDRIYPIDSEELKRKILSLCLNKVNPSYDFFGKKNRSIKVNSSNEYDEPLTRNDRLMAVAKLDKNKFNTNYPVDILLTDFIKPTFLEDFDFDICKASVCFVNHSLRKAFPKSAVHLIGRFVCNLDFWADVKNKKITYDVTGRGVKEIDRSFENHLPRIKSKYPEFELLIIGENKASISYINTKMFANKLSKDLDNKPIGIKKKNKI